MSSVSSHFFTTTSGCRWMIALLAGLWLAGGAMAQVEQGDVAAGNPPSKIPVDLLTKTWGVGPWIWGSETHEKQTCRL